MSKAEGIAAGSSGACSRSRCGINSTSNGHRSKPHVPKCSSSAEMGRPLVAYVVGARPNYMKVAPVYAELERRGQLEQRLVHTGQHYDALLKDVFFAELPLPKPHFQLDARTTESALDELEGVFRDLQPELVVVAGDVNSTLAGAVAAKKCGVQ